MIESFENADLSSVVVYINCLNSHLLLSEPFSRMHSVNDRIGEHVVTSVKNSLRIPIKIEII